MWVWIPDTTPWILVGAAAFAVGCRRFFQFIEDDQVRWRGIIQDHPYDNDEDDPNCPLCQRRRANHERHHRTTADKDCTVCMRNELKQRVERGSLGQGSWKTYLDTHPHICLAYHKRHHNVYPKRDGACDLCISQYPL